MVVKKSVRMVVKKSVRKGRKLKFKINRSKWRCGGKDKYSHGEGETALLNEEGYMCCLGQMCLQAGFSENQIQDKAEPSDLDEYVAPQNPYGLQITPKIGLLVGEPELEVDGTRSRYLVVDPYNFCSAAIQINDDGKMTPATREKRLAALAKNHNVEIVFVGKYNDKKKKD